MRGGKKNAQPVCYYYYYYFFFGWFSFGGGGYHNELSLIASGVCVCLNRHKTLKTSYIIRTEKVNTAKCILWKDHYKTQSLQATISAAWKSGCYSCVGAEHWLVSAERDCSFSCCSTLPHYDANGWKQICWSSVCVRFFFFFGQWNLQCHFTQTIYVSEIERERGTRTFGGLKENLWKTFYHFFHTSWKGFFFSIKHATDLSMINNWMKWNKICCFKCPAF